MSINKNVFLHESDKAALKALKSIPGFTQVMRAFMRVWSERMMYIKNMSTHVRISEDQLPHYYEMLPPICDKLGIDVPDLFLELDITPNAYTSGDTHPFIVMTSGLIETLPDELIQTVLAHECGHIACHHVLYSSMGQFLFNGMAYLLPIPDAALIPVEIALAYWMRCSEFSADRAAILCDGQPDKVMEMCMRFAGFDKDIPYEMNLDAFMKQAEDYRTMMKDSKVNKAMELAMFSFEDHPLNAVRAYEARKWSDSEDFLRSKQFFDSYKKDEAPPTFPISGNEKHFIGRPVDEVEKELYDLGFDTIEYTRITDKSLFSKAGTITALSVGGSNKYKEGDWVSSDSIIEATYYQPLSEEEEAMLHPGEIRMPNAPNYFKGKEFREIEAELIDLGFTRVIVDELRDITKDSDKKVNRVASLTIDKSPKFSKGDWIPVGAEILITYHALK